MEATEFWKKCSTCKKPIAFGAKYYVCSVSTCSGQRTGYVFCSMNCFEAHVPGARHRDAGAIAHTAPTQAQAAATASTASEGAARTPARIIARPGASVSTPSAGTTTSGSAIPKEVLVIASRLKDYVHARAEMNTSASVMDVLSEHLRIICDRGMENARADGRKTLMDRDFEFLKK